MTRDLVRFSLTILLAWPLSMELLVSEESEPLPSGRFRLLIEKTINSSFEDPARLAGRQANRAYLENNLKGYLMATAATLDMRKDVWIAHTSDGVRITDYNIKKLTRIPAKDSTDLTKRWIVLTRVSEPEKPKHDATVRVALTGQQLELNFEDLHGMASVMYFERLGEVND